MRTVRKSIQQSRSGANGELEALRATCRAGNPFPLIAYQWPELLVRGDDSRFFEGTVGSTEDPCLRLDSWQRLIISSFFDVTLAEIFIKGCTGAGKGLSSALLINLIYDAYPECRVHITGPNADHARTILLGEAKDWRSRMRIKTPGEENMSGWSTSKKHQVVVLNPPEHDTGEVFSGRHSAFTIFFFDEASKVPYKFYDNALKNMKKAVAISNPRTNSGWFRDAFKPLRGDDDATDAERLDRENRTGRCYGRLGQRLCVTVGGMDCSNTKHRRLKEPVAPPRGIEINGRHYVAGERISDEDYVNHRPLIPKQIDLTQYQSTVDKSEEPWKVECFAEGRFPSEDPAKQVVLGSWLGFHQQSWRPNLSVTGVGLDVARSKSGDSNALVTGGLGGVDKIYEEKLDTYTKVVKWLRDILGDVYSIDVKDGTVPICIDYGGGYGAGPGDRLHQLGAWVIEHIPQGKPVVTVGQYENQRSEWYNLLGRRLSPHDIWQGFPLALPEHPRLAPELTAPLKVPKRSNTVIGLESKTSIKERLGVSPDVGDAVVCWWRAVFIAHDLADQLRGHGVTLVIDADDDFSSEDPVVPGVCEDDDFFDELVSCFSDELPGGRDAPADPPGRLSMDAIVELLGGGDEVRGDAFR